MKNNYISGFIYSNICSMIVRHFDTSVKPTSIMVLLNVAFLVLSSFTIGTHGGFFSDALDAIKTKANSLVTSAGLQHLNPMRMLEKGPEVPCPEVKTTMGKVKGIAEFSRDKAVFFSYLGIPYAKPPTGARRFLPPSKFDEEWTTVRQTVEYPPPCIQFDMVLAGGVTGLEDCLYLSVATKSIDSDKKYDVIVHIHGGIGMSGNSANYHPKYLMDLDIVFVTLNYRLGALGYLNSGEGTINGNMGLPTFSFEYRIKGLQDQKLALDWVKENIEKFGGNANQITLMGDSTGAVAAHFHVLSSASKGLFHRAILQSGHALSPWGFTTDHVGQFKAFSENFNCPQDDLKYWLKCMQKKDVMEIVEVHSSSESPTKNPHEVFTVSVQSPVDGTEIVTEHPFVTLASGNFSTDIPIIFGVNKADGAGLTSRIEAHDEIKKTLSISWNTYVPLFLNYEDNTKISKALKKHYMPLETEVPEEDVTPIMQMITEADFLYPLYQVLSYYRKTSADVHVYLYTYKGQFSFYPALKSYKKESFTKGKLSVATTLAAQFMSKAVGGVYASDGWGPVFGDQLIQLFYYTTAMEVVQESGDYEFSKKFVSSLVDFAKGRKDLKFDKVDWPSLKKEGNIEMMMIDKDASVISDNKLADIAAFYEGLHIRDPPPQLMKPDQSKLSKGDITPIG